MISLQLHLDPYAITYLSPHTMPSEADEHFFFIWDESHGILFGSLQLSM